jgi:tRNA pseudouridine38-40 synthase
MTRYRATVAYDGTAYEGWQRLSPGHPSVQAALEAAIAQVSRQAVEVIGAGRTDSGVHAAGQVIAFEVDWKHGSQALLKAINHALPRDIALQDLTIQDDFHPRFDAISRTYGYQVAMVSERQPLALRTCWQVAAELDLAAMNAAAALLIGRHDFATFGSPPDGVGSTTREVFASVWQVQPSMVGRIAQYTITATAFLRHMVRRIVWMLVEVGRERLSLEAFQAAFLARDLSRSGKLAPPQGLILVEVRYPPLGTRRSSHHHQVSH